MTAKSKTPEIRFKGFTDPWEQRKLGELCTFSKGHGYSKADIRDVGIPLILYGRLYTQYESHIEDVDTFAVEQDGSLFSKGNEVIVPASGETAEDIAIASSVRRSGIILGGDLNVITPGSELDPDYTAIGITYGEAHKDLSKRAQGKSVVHVHGDDIADVEFTYPAIEEQRAISSLVLNLDSLITLHQRKHEKLVQMKKAMLDKMFPKPGEKFPEIRFKGFTDPWEQRKFEEVFTERREKTEKELEDVLLSCAISGMYLNSELFGHFRGTTTIGYLKVKKNDLILSAQNLHLGNVNVNLRFDHGIISPAYKVYDLNDCLPEFVQAWVKKESTKKFFLDATTEGASQCRKNIEWDTLGKQTISMPVKNEQKLIGRYFSRLDSLITLHQRKLELLKNIKKAMLEKMFV